MKDTLYNLIRNNRNSTPQRIKIEVTYLEVAYLYLLDPATGKTHEKSTIHIITNKEVEDDQSHQSNIFTLYRRSSIRKLLGNLTESLIQTREDNMTR